MLGLYLITNSIIWSPYIVGHTEAIEETQNRFLRSVAFKCDIFRKQHSPFEPFLSFLSLESWSSRRIRLYNICFIYKLLNGSVTVVYIVQNYCTKLTSLFLIVEPNNYTFNVPSKCTKYSRYVPINGFMYLVIFYFLLLILLLLTCI